MNRYLRIVAAALAALPALLVLRPALPALHNPAGPPKAGSSADRDPDAAARRIVALTNRERMNRGLPPLSFNRTLSRSAAWLAKDMAEHGYFSHTDRLQRSIDRRLPDFGYAHYHAIGENIAAGMRSPALAVNGWMHSEGHRRNILSPDFSEIGAGIALNPGSKYKRYWVEDFGDRFRAHPIVIDDESGRTADRNVHLTVHGGRWPWRMRLSNDSDRWTPWIPYRGKLDWALEPGSGERTVYVELRGPDGIERESDSTVLTDGQAQNDAPASESHGGR
jgi:uncharacterized protein YkwD